MYEHFNGRPPPGSTTDPQESDDSTTRRFPGRLFFILDTATELVLTARKIKDKETRELVRLRRKNAVRWMLRLKVAFGPLWDPRKNRRGSQAVCRCLCHLYSAVEQCYEAMRREVVTILPLFAFWAEEDLISEDWFEEHVISGDGKRSSLTNRELTTITRPIEQNADHIDHLIGDLRDMVWREFKDWPRRDRSPAAPDPSPRVQKGLPALPRSPTPEAAANGPIPEAPADRIELAAAPSGNETAATNRPALEAQAAGPLVILGEPGGQSPAPQIDFAALAAELRKVRKPTQAALLEYMASKREATVEDVAEHVHANGETDEKTVRANAVRTNDSLTVMGAPLSFRVASGRVFREISQK